MNEQTEQFFSNAKKWKQEFLLLREIVLKNKSLDEAYKWMKPCYTLNGKNVVLIHGFKEYCALLFHKGVLLKDTSGIMIQQTQNVQAARQIRFTNIKQIQQLKSVIQEYIKEAVGIEKSGKQIALKKVDDYPISDEFRLALAGDSALYKAFYALTAGRQKGYLFYFNQAKQSKTRQGRIEKYYNNILDGKGMDD